jgi:N6-adenosine-specific RNA methylase IME4
VNELAKLDKATQMLAEAKTLDEVKNIIDIAEAARVYARAAKLGLEAYNHAAEVKARAERKAGEFLAQLERGKGGRPNNSLQDVNSLSEYKEVLDENGIGYVSAHRWQQVAEMPEPVFEKHLEEMRGERPITTSGILKEIQAERNKNKPVIPIPNGKFNVFYGDPPWKYDNSGFDQSAASKYPTMSTPEICELPIENITMPDSVLFLWVTSPLLEDGFMVLNAWGFDYKACMIWEKNRAPGMGFWLQTYHEILLIGSKGSFLPSIKPPSIVKADVTEHSKKPHEFYGIIESMYPGSQKIELFARNKRDGWEAWGNEV